MDATKFLQMLTQEATDKFPAQRKTDTARAVLFDKLERLWMLRVSLFAEETWEISAAAYLLLIKDFTEEELKEELEHFRAFLVHARHTFVKKTKVFETKIVDRSERGKHWLTKQMSDVEVVAKTAKVKDPKKEGSLFYYAVKRETLDQFLWIIMGQRFEEFLHQKHKFYYLRADRSIGAVAGEEVDIIRFDVDYKAREAHAYPIKENEVSKEDLGRIVDLKDIGISTEKVLDIRATYPPEEATPHADGE